MAIMDYNEPTDWEDVKHSGDIFRVLEYKDSCITDCGRV